MKNKDRNVQRLSLYRPLLIGSRKSASLAIIVLALSGLAEALGLVSLLPLLEQSSPTFETLFPVFVALALFLILASLLKLLGDFLIGRVTTEVEFRARKQLTTRLVYGPWLGVSRLSQGEITAAVMSESTQLSNGIYALLSGAGSLVVVAILFLAAAVINPGLLGLTLVFIVASVVIFKQRLKYVRVNESSLSASTTEIAEEISSSLGDMKFLRISGSDRPWLINAHRNARDLRRFRQKQIMLPSITRSIIDSVAAVFLVLVIAVALLLQGEIGLGLVFVALFYRIIPRVQTVQTQLNTAFGQLPWIEKWNSRLTVLHDVEPDQIRRTTTLGADFEPAPSGGSLSFEVEDVSLHYSGRVTPALDGVTFHIRPNERVAFIGPSGSGKTTLLDLLLGLFPPTAGTIKVNGKLPSSEDWNEFRASVGIVPQEVPVKRGTLAENIVWDREIERDLLERVIAIAQLEPLVREMPQGIDSFIDSKTIGLSGGQRQRVALARALYRRPSLLVLDEGTSALDTATEEAFLDAVNDIEWPMTVVVVTHRETALKHIDRVIRLKDGKIHEPYPERNLS